MNVEFAKIDDVNGELTLTIEEKDYAPEVAKRLKEISKQRPEPGFRPGKTPIALIQKKYGDAAKYDAINKLVGDTIFNYIKEQNLNVLGNPVPEENNEIDIHGTDYTLKFKVGLAPEINVNVNKDLKIPFYTIKVEDKMVERQDEMLRRRFGTREEGEEIQEISVVRGVITELDENGEVKEGGIMVENGILSPEHFKDEDQKALFIGKKKDEEIRFNPAKASGESDVEMGSMLHISKEDALNHKGDFRFKVTDIISLKPAEENQEYYDQIFGKDQVHNHEEYVEALKKLIAEQLANDSRTRFTIDAREALVNAAGDITLPDEVLKNFLLRSENSDLTPEDADEKYAQMRPQLVWELITGAVAKQLGVKIEEEDLRNLARMVARNQFAQYGVMSPDEETVNKFANDILKEKEAVDRLANQAFADKFFGAIHEAVTTEPKEVTVEEFNALFAK